MNHSETSNKMGVMPIPTLMLSMGLPMILSMIVQAFYNIVDSFFVSNMTSGELPDIGSYAMNALTLSFPIQMLMIAIGVGTGVGVGALLSKSLGEGNLKQASLIAGNAVFLGLCTYGAFLLFGLFGVKWFLKTQTSDPVILDLGCSYLRICTLLSFGCIGSMIYEKLLQSTGKTTWSTLAQLAGAVTNILLDPLMIYGLWGFPKMGISGAAAATVAGQILTLILGIFFHYTRNREIDGSLIYLRPSKTTIKNIYQVGAPAILMQALMSVMSYGINIIFGLVSTAAVTAFGIYYKIQQFVFFAAFGMNNALIPIVAFNYGKGDRKRIGEGIRYGMLYTLALMLAGAAILFAFGSRILSAFSLSPEVEVLCLRAIRLIAPGYLFAGANITFQGVFQALGCGIKSLIVSVIRLILVTLPLAWFLATLPDGVFKIWLAFPIAEAAGLAAALWFMNRISRKTLSQISTPALP